MFFTILYCGVGIYVLLIVAGKVHKDLGRKMERPQRLGIIALGTGLIILGLYYAFHAYFFSTPAGKDYQRLQRDMQRGYQRR